VDESQIDLTAPQADNSSAAVAIDLPPAPRQRSGRGARLKTAEVSAWFGQRQVLDGVTLTMEPGQVTALIGPSGCGKSTFLRILNRMHEFIPSAGLAGQIRLNDMDIYGADARRTEIRRRIGMVFQKPNPFPAMSVRQNVLAGLKLNGMKPDNRDDVVEQSLRRAGLWDEVLRRLDAPGGALSGGQQQRLCIARSLAVEPDVLLMDEPCSALDPVSTRRIEETIAEIADDVTVVIVTHNMQQAARVSDHCAFFLATADTPGRIVEAGPRDQIFGSPRDKRTSDYVHGRFG
jgi:phosphate transport system ATP-binding protein